jgi:hypothetical protein
VNYLQLALFEQRPLRAMARRTGIHEELLSDIRSGRVVPRDREVAAIAAALGGHPPSLLLREVPPLTVNAPEAEAAVSR